MRHAVVVGSRPGAGSTTRTEYRAKATPDGHTLLVSSGSSMVMNGLLYSNLPYDSLRDFVAVGFIAAYPFLLIARADLPVSNPPELVKYAKEWRVLIRQRKLDGHVRPGGDTACHYRCAACSLRERRKRRGIYRSH
jgi:tripartite-type tricarboxylate transporter receptor subunit TctC